MIAINSSELRKLWLDFFSGHGHKVINSASLIPENDPTVLFTTAGMHPLVPYLLGAKHPMGNRLCNVQKCVRTGDIDEVGDATHCTFFEMLGNWSLGDYFKEEMIPMSYEFLTKVLGIDPGILSVSVFAGDENAPRDEVSAKLWERCGIPSDRIFYLPKENNWWGPAGKTGPCGPDTEMFIDMGKEKCSPDCSPACSCGKYVEIWNDVFMEYNKNAGGVYEPLSQKNVDTGMGLERTLCILDGKKSVYETDLFIPVIAAIEKMTPHKYNENESVMRAFRIIADHVRTSVFMIGDIKGITPGNVDQGYVLRRLIRRAVRFAKKIELNGKLSGISEAVIERYKEAYPELATNREKIINELNLEEERFERTLTTGLKEFERLIKNIDLNNIDGKSAFRLYDTYGFPIEMTVELAHERGLTVDTAGFEQAFAEHQKTSQAGSEQRFKGGLADSTESTARLHTATHLLHAALKKVLGPEVNQRGSNITEERLRFDFSFGRKMEDHEIKEVESLVNEAIKANAQIICEELTVAEAKAQGAIGLFDEKYGEKVKVYSMGKFSKEICGGPHAENTGELGVFKISKEQSSSAGVRRIKAELVI